MGGLLARELAPGVPPPALRVRIRFFLVEPDRPPQYARNSPDLPDYAFPEISYYEKVGEPKCRKSDASLKERGGQACPVFGAISAFAGGNCSRSS